MYLNFDKMRRTLDQQSRRDKSSCWTKSETVPLFWIPLSLQVTSRKYTSRKLSGAVFCNMSINNYMNVHTGIPPRFLKENQNSSFTDTFNKYQTFKLTQNHLRNADLLNNTLLSIGLLFHQQGFSKRAFADLLYSHVPIHLQKRNLLELTFHQEK